MSLNLELISFVQADVHPKKAIPDCEIGKLLHESSLYPPSPPPLVLVINPLEI